MFKKLDPLLHSELRLAVVSVLVNLEEADFVYLREATGATAGNLSVSWTSSRKPAIYRSKRPSRERNRARYAASLLSA